MKDCKHTKLLINGLCAKCRLNTFGLTNKELKHAKIHGDYGSWSDLKLARASAKLYEYLSAFMTNRDKDFFSDLLEIERELTLRENQ